MATTTTTTPSASPAAAAAFAALTDLREHLIKGKSVRVEENEVVLADLDGVALKSFPKHAPTAYHSKNSPDKTYDVLAVFTCYRYAALTFSDYVLKCRSEKATMVSTVDKKDLIAFLKGDIDASPQILGADGKPTAAAADGATGAADGDSAKSAKADAANGSQRSGDAAADAKKRKLSHDAKDGERHKDHKRESQKPASTATGDGAGASHGASASDSAIKRILDRECTFRNRTSVLNAQKKTFENVLKLIELVNAETKEKIEKASKASLLAPVSNARKEQLPLSRLMKDKIPGTPIIVVPAGFSDLFTMLNVKDFLEDGVYVPNMQKKAEGCRKAQSIILQHEEDGEQYTFKIVDSVARFRDKDWRCVVGVIASGQSWQFKGWKWKFPLEVFKKVCGIHIYTQGAQLGEDIKQWDVKILMIHPDKRHLDKVAAKEFWSYLFAFLKTVARGEEEENTEDAPEHEANGLAGALEDSLQQHLQLQATELGENERKRAWSWRDEADCARSSSRGAVGSFWKQSRLTALDDGDKLALRNRKAKHGDQFVAVTSEEEEQTARAAENKKHGANMPSSTTSAAGSSNKPMANNSALASASGSAGTANTGPAPVLKTTATLAHLASSKSFNKVAPEDMVATPAPSPKERVLLILENKYISSFLTLCTIFALFGDDIRVSFCPKSADTTIYNLLFICFIFFSMELILSVYSRPNYFNRGLGFSFYLDMVSTLSVIPDVEWIWSHVISSTSASGSSSQTAALKAGRASRAGTKAGRIVRLVRLFRMLRILRVLKKNKNQDAQVVEISEPSKIGKVLTEKTTKRLIILVLLIIIVSPIIDGSVDLTQDDFQESQLERLHRYTQDYNQSGQISEEHMKKMVEEYARDCNGLLVDMHITNIEHAKLTEWLQDVKFQKLDSDETDWDFTSPYSLTTNPKTGWTAAKYLTDDPSEKYRTNEYTTIENYGCYVDNLCTDCSTATSTNQTCHSWVSFDISSFTIGAGKLNIGKTVVVMICFGVSIFVLTRDAEVMVIGPIERMMRLVTQLAQNPLGATEAKKELYEGDEQGEDYETKMLEDTLGKIGRLLQVGFGAAGTEIIAKNMGGAGELDVMIPGKKITSIFGFGIIEHFTETCSLLEEDVITYINTIAEIVHGDAKIFHGAANKNIGSAFLLAWKMCDGSLPGMRDPRDPADKPRMDTAEKLKRREGIFIKSAGSGTVARRVTPTELVDSALTAILKMRVDIHNANHHGTLHKFCTNKKLVAAFEDFEVHLGFGLHIGWAIEGAIGSKYKIDASYLSPNVNMAARLEAATGQFDVPMLLSEWFVDELSVEARRFCRKIDRVAVKGSEIPMDLWTFDIGHYPTDGVPPIVFEGKQKAVEFGIDPIYKTLQEGIPKAFFENFHEGIGAYFGGKWDLAKEKLSAANQIWEDGPTKVVLKVMETESKGTFTAPTWWKGFRQLTEK